MHNLRSWSPSILLFIPRNIRFDFPINFTNCSQSVRKFIISSLLVFTRQPHPFVQTILKPSPVRTAQYPNARVFPAMPWPLAASPNAHVLTPRVEGADCGRMNIKNFSPEVVLTLSMQGVAFVLLHRSSSQTLPLSTSHSSSSQML